MFTVSQYPFVANLRGPYDITALAQDGTGVGGSRVEWVANEGVRFYPSHIANTYCAFRNIFVPRTKRLVIGEMLWFTDALVANVVRRFKHIIVNRYSETTGMDSSGLRGMTYVWGAEGDLTFGACLSTECVFEGGGNRPEIGQSFWLSRRTNQWIWVESDYDLVTHTAKVFVTTADGVFDHYLLATKELTAIEPELDYWHRIDTLGFYADLGVTAHPDAYMGLRELRISDSHIGAPSYFYESPEVPQVPTETPPAAVLRLPDVSGGLHRVFVGDIEISRHDQLKEALQRANVEYMAGAEDEVRIRTDDIVLRR